MPYNKSFIDQASSVKMGGYWPRSLFAFLWTSTSSRSIKTQKENSANQAYHMTRTPGPARAFIAKLLRKSPYEGRTRWPLMNLKLQHPKERRNEFIK